MTKKQLAAVVSAVVAVAGGLGLAVNGQAQASGVDARVKALEGHVIEQRVQVTEMDKRLERMETKLDKLIERGR